MVRVKRCNVLIILTLFGASSVGKVYGDDGIDHFTGTADSAIECATTINLPGICCPSLLNEQSTVPKDYPGMGKEKCGCRCGGVAEPITDATEVEHYYCPAGQGYTASARTRYTTIAGGAGGAEGASSSFAAELHPINNVLILSIVIFVMFFTL